MIGAIADDFTGATDVAVAFRRAGLRTRLFFGVPPEDVALEPTEAAEAVELARTLVRPGDAVLVKASRAAGLEGIADEITNFARAWSPS